MKNKEYLNMANYGMVKNSAVFFRGPFMHEARKKFATIKEAIESACNNSYSLNSSDVDIFKNISDIHEADEVIQKYMAKFDENSWNIPTVGETNSYDDENGLVEESEEGEKNSFYYQTSTGTNQLMIREELDENGEKNYLAIYRVESRNPIEKSTAMQAFENDGWECRCILAQIRKDYEVHNCLKGNEDYGISEYGPEDFDYSHEERNAYMLDTKLPEDVMEEMDEENIIDECDIPIEKRDSYSEEEAIQDILERMRNYKVEYPEFSSIPDKIKITKLEPIQVQEYGKKKRAYQAPENTEGTIIECSLMKERDEFILYVKQMDPIQKSFEWSEDKVEMPPSKEMIDEIKKAIEEEEKMYSVSEVMEGIEPRKDEMEKTLRETTQIAEQKDTRSEEDREETL